MQKRKRRTRSPRKRKGSQSGSSDGSVTSKDGQSRATAKAGPADRGSGDTVAVQTGSIKDDVAVQTGPFDDDGTVQAGSANKMPDGLSLPLSLYSKEEGSGSVHRALGIQRPKEQNEPFEYPELGFALFRKFHHVNISVDTLKFTPERVWYLPANGERPTVNNCYSIIDLTEDYAFPVQESFETYRAKWHEIQQSGQSTDMNLVMSLLDSFANRLEFRDVKRRWEFKEHCGNTINEDMTKNNIYGLFHAMRLGAAFVKKMSCDIANVAVKGLFDIAAIVAFGGIKGLDIAVADVVSSSCVKEQAFPLVEAPQGRLGESGLEDLQNGATSDDFLLAEGEASFQDDASVRSDDSMVTSLRGISPASKQSNNSSPECPAQIRHSRLNHSIYADVVVMSGHEPNWPRFLVVIEMKTQEDFSSKAMDQIIREMLAPMMHQSFVFGLVMNDLMAVIYLMYHDFEKKQIQIKKVLKYFFETSLKDEIKIMFVDIVAMLDFAKHNIQEVCHGF